jgi:trans-aconitate 2-methyltransferase
MKTDNYTFGDNEQASERLRRLAELYEPETRELLELGRVESPRLGVDLGCGPGWSTRLIRDVLHPDRTVGLDASERYIAEARQRHVTEARQQHGAGLEFEVHDVSCVPFPVQAPDVMFCRFLLTHLHSLGQVLNGWTSAAAPNAVLFVHETESLETEHPALRRYYELVDELQEHYGQTLRVGALLEANFRDSGWALIESNRRSLGKSAADMAGLHLANLRTWRNDAYACRTFNPTEIDSLEASLERIATGTENAGIVVNAARQIVARRR